jgi:hypothetical protein
MLFVKIKTNYRCKVTIKTYKKTNLLLIMLKKL